MPAACAGKCLARLLLLCLYISLSGGSPADPAMTTQGASSQSQANSVTNMKNGLNESFREPMATTQIINWQTQGRPSDHLTFGREVSVPALLGPSLATKESRQTSNQSVASVQYELLLPGASGTSVDTTISLDKAVEVELTCILDKEYSYLKTFQVTWKTGNETVSHTNKTDSRWSIKVSVSDSSKLGSYSCTLKGEKQLSGIFHLQVPKIEQKEKPTISYLRDTAVMSCECPGYTAISWTWYMTNGSKRIVINESLVADRYVISKKSASITQLKILKLSKEDGGEYWCEATFELGKSEGRLELKVLSFVVPLKPFIAIVVEVIVFVALIVCYEIYSTKVKRTEAEKEFDQNEHLKSEESGLESSEARQRRI